MAIAKVYQPEFQNLLKTVQNPYAKENTAENILKILKTERLDNVLQKEFYDM